MRLSVISTGCQLKAMPRGVEPQTTPPLWCSTQYMVRQISRSPIIWKQENVSQCHEFVTLKMSGVLVLTSTARKHPRKSRLLWIESSMTAPPGLSIGVLSGSRFVKSLDTNNSFDEPAWHLLELFHPSYFPRSSKNHLDILLALTNCFRLLQSDCGFLSLILCKRMSCIKPCSDQWCVQLGLRNVNIKFTYFLGWVKQGLWCIRDDTLAS